MKEIKLIIDEKGQNLIVDYSILSDGTYLCAIRGFVEPVQKSKAGIALRSELGVGVARTRYYALNLATADFRKKYTSDDRNHIMEASLAGSKISF